MDSEIIMLKETSDSCSTRLDKARAALGLRELQIKKLETIDSQNESIMVQKDYNLKGCRDINLNLQNKNKVLKITSIAAPVATFVLGFIVRKGLSIGP